MIINVGGWISALEETTIAILNVSGSVSGDDKGRDLGAWGADYRWIGMKEAVHRGVDNHGRLGLGGDL